jgi:hypothetical protein
MTSGVLFLHPILVSVLSFEFQYDGVNFISVIPTLRMLEGVMISHQLRLTGFGRKSPQSQREPEWTTLKLVNRGRLHPASVTSDRDFAIRIDLRHLPG